ncbi:MAG: hypothetical protein DRI57_16875 [Deltaproteobacteria bacterium]|nr:MAG: hypothetical protein DRI57_16875 [Deltaproteobacteria bacterium]
MKIINKIGLLCFYVMAGGICVHILGTEALAGEEPGNWRKTWDLVMLWINFGILAFVVVKFGRLPIMNFLNGRRDELGREIKQAEQEKEKITAKIKETFTILDESEIHFADMKQKIIDQGEKKKQNIMEDARQQSRIMIESSKQKVESQLIQAKNNFKAEMIDAAIALATEKLPNQITDEDNLRFADNYLSETLKG